MRFEMDTREAMSEFRENGTVTLEAPYWGEFSLELWEATGVRADDAEIIYHSQTSNEVIREEPTSLHLYGFAVDRPEAEARITLAEEGVFGLILSPQYKFSFTPTVSEEGSLIQTVEALYYGPDWENSGLNLPSFLDRRLQGNQENVATLPAMQWNDSMSVEIARTEVLTGPWEMGEAETLGVVLSTEDHGNREVTVRVEFSEEGRIIHEARSSPVTVDNRYTTLANVTTVLPKPGFYEAVVSVEPLNPPDQASLDTTETQVNVTRPLDLPASTYIRIESSDGWRPATPGEVSEERDRITVTPQQHDDCCNVSVHSAWLKYRLDTVASDVAWDQEIHGGEQWYQVRLDERRKVTFSTFRLSSTPQFTAGSEDIVELMSRPMWISVERLDKRGLADRPGLQAVLTLNISGETTDGQSIRFSSAWLEAQDVSDPVFGYPGGHEIPSDCGRLSCIAEAPHFSLVNIYDFECQDCTPGSPPPSTHWTDETSGGTFEITDATSVLGSQAVLVRGGGTDNHKWVHRDDSMGQPSSLDFWARIETPDDPPNWHRLIWRGYSGTLTDFITVNLRSLSATETEACSGGACLSGPVLPPNEWFLVRVRNIDWSNCTYTFKIEQHVVGTGLNMDSTDCSSASLDQVRIGSKGWGAEGWILDTLRFDDGTLTTSDVVFDIPQGYQDAYPSTWQSRVENAFFLYDQVWANADIEVDLRLQEVHGWNHNIVNGTTDCFANPDPLEVYQDWLLASPARDRGADAYQLWTHENISCWGDAYVDSVGGILGASIVNALDDSEPLCYDPSEDDDVAIVSGHELGHVYGEEGHPGTTNMMGTDCPEDRSFTFLESTNTEIRSRFHYNLEHDY